MFFDGRLGRLVDGMRHVAGLVANARECPPELRRVQPLEKFGGAAGRMSAAATQPRNMCAHQKVLPINDTEVRIENFCIQLSSLLLTILAYCTFRAAVDR